MTFPPKTRPLAWKCQCAEMGPQGGAMTRNRHTEEQIIAVLKDAQAGIGVQELCRKHGISDATFYKWRAKYAGLEVSDVKKLRQLEDENRRLKQMVAEQALDIQALKAITAKNW
jgi:putative transposase